MTKYRITAFRQNDTMETTWKLFTAEMVELGIAENREFPNAMVESKGGKSLIASHEIGILFGAYLQAEDPTQRSDYLKTAHKQFCPDFQMRYFGF